MRNLGMGSFKLGTKRIIALSWAKLFTRSEHVLARRYTGVLLGPIHGMHTLSGDTIHCHYIPIYDLTSFIGVSSS